MVSTIHYVPILRWKQAERFALRHLHEKDRGRIIPLIEITPKSFDAPKTGKKEGKKPDPGQVLEDEAKELLVNWQYAPFFLDLHLIDGLIPAIGGVHHALVHIAETARRFKLHLIPVIGVNRTDEYKSAVSRVAHMDGRGICLRLLATEVLKPRFAQKLRAVLRNIELDKNNVDLMLDYQRFDPQNPDLKTLLAKIPDLSRWRSFIVACGAFPQDLQKCEKGSNRIPRNDWRTWKSQFVDETSIQRRPSFSDYANQYGLYKEPVENCNPSASIRYTLEDEWLVMRGEAPRGKVTSEKAERRPGREQYNAHAQLLCEDTEIFYGQDFSWGDDFIYKRSVNKEDHGSPEIWLRAGINHHMTVVSRQIANLAGP
jgi:hypothetical protein